MKDKTEGQRGGKLEEAELLALKTKKGARSPGSLQKLEQPGKLPLTPPASRKNAALLTS